ncbi:hypothetical protein D3C80_1775170 [compost metagenome]
MKSTGSRKPLTEASKRPRDGSPKIGRAPESSGTAAISSTVRPCSLATFTTVPPKRASAPTNRFGAFCTEDNCCTGVSVLPLIASGTVTQPDNANAPPAIASSAIFLLTVRVSIVAIS